MLRTVLYLTGLCQIEIELHFLCHWGRSGIASEFMMAESGVCIAPGISDHVAVHWRLELVPYERMHVHRALATSQFTSSILEGHMHEDPLDKEFVLPEELHVQGLQLARCAWRDL